MNKQQLDRWAELLFDTGKRNNLVNFKDSKSSSVEIVYPDMMSFLEHIEKNSRFEVYNPYPERSYRRRRVADDELAEREETKEEYIDKYSHCLGKHEILVYNRANKPYQVIKKIADKGKSSIDETGVNTMYMVFGFIRWSESVESDTVMSAPLLLAPIEISRESTADPFVIVVHDDEMIVNPTFAYKLQLERGIELPEFNGDYSSYFEKVEDRLYNLGWSVSLECKIGHFSFLKINMYQDIKENADAIMRSTTIKEMMGEASAEKVNEAEEEEYNLDDIRRRFMELHNVVDADSSQMEAIAMAKSGKSFVLQGPPGTGKSQTITNIIAECLVDGKKILFVSEKLAALNVVYEKLRRVGLDEFCLELHSHKVNKKAVIEELNNTLIKGKTRVAESAMAEIRHIQERQEKLNRYVEELHRKRHPYNRSLYRIYEEIAAYRDCPNLDAYITGVENEGEDFLYSLDEMMKRYVNYTEKVGLDYHKNTWYGYTGESASYYDKMSLKGSMQKVIDLSVTLSGIASKVNSKLGIVTDTIAEAEAMRELARLIIDAKYIAPDLFNSERLEVAANHITEAKRLITRIRRIEETLSAEFDEDIYQLDASINYKKLAKEYKNLFFRIFSPGYWSIIKGIRLCQKESRWVGYKKALEVYEMLKERASLLSSFKTHEAKFAPYLSIRYENRETDFDLLSYEVETLKSVSRRLPGISVLIHSDLSSLVDSFANVLREYDAAFAESSMAEKCLYELFAIDIFDIMASPFSKVKLKLNKCLADFDRLEDWVEFASLLRELESVGARSLVDMLISRKTSIKHYVGAVKKIVLRQWESNISASAKTLRELSRVTHDEYIARFKHEDLRSLEVNKAIIRSTVSQSRPSTEYIAPGGAVAILKREGEKKRKQKGVRQLMLEIPGLIQAIKPCFMMSPLSVSTFLSPNMKFDVVIFDEASQIFPQDAIGAIYRGEQLIVVGDSKQMPPSNFFNSSLESDEEIDEDISDYESVLDLCSTVMPYKRLKWHYRSKYEELITFSNRNFYRNELITFPSSKCSLLDTGVDYYYVDGTFDRMSKTNRIEAEKVVNLVFEHFEKYPDRSIGVVAFSISQQSLIEDLVYKRRIADQRWENFFTMNKDEPFFVKNLETVQGDERDTIIFSTAYAKGSDGKFIMNFGPLNRSGGERRLNVAVTRAKHNVKLVTSMRYTEIDLTRTNSEGVRLLRQYLEYADRGVEAIDRDLDVSGIDQYDSDFELEVCEFLRNKGYSVDTQVGCSSFRIDLALKEPNSSNYLLAIECDGASYHSSKTARDRDRLRQSILESMGWRFYRIWSTDWYRSPAAEKEKLLKAVKDAISRIPPPPPPVEEDGGDIVIDVIEDESTEFPYYDYVDTTAIQRKCNYDPVMITFEVLKRESPLSEKWLLHRIVNLFGGDKVTNKVIENFNIKMSGCRAYGIRRKEGVIFLAGKDNCMLRIPRETDAVKRDILYIPLAELANGMRSLIRQNVAVEKEGLFRILAKLCGFARVGNAIQDHMEKALILLSDEITVRDGKIMLKEDL